MKLRESIAPKVKELLDTITYEPRQNEESLREIYSDLRESYNLVRDKKSKLGQILRNRKYRRVHKIKKDRDYSQTKAFKLMGKPYHLFSKEEKTHYYTLLMREHRRKK